MKKFLMNISLLFIILEVSAEYVVSPIRPMYECDPIRYAIPLSSWYFGCKASCSPFSGKNMTTLEFYKDRAFSDPIVLYMVDVHEVKVTAHTDLLNNCFYLDSSYPISITEEYVTPLRSEVLKVAGDSPNNSTFLLGTRVIPDCSYFRDLYSSYKVMVVQKYLGDLVQKKDGPVLISIPALNVEVEYDKGEALFGSSIIVWNNSDIPNMSCGLKLLGEDQCVVHNNLSSYECQGSGSVYHLKEDMKDQGRCSIQDVWYLGNGLYITEAKEQTKTSDHYTINSLAKELSQGDIAGVISEVNDVYGKFTDILCESICDLSDQVYSIKENSTSVIETPIGPWLGWRNSMISFDHMYYVSGCRRVTDWQLFFPLIVCPDNQGFLIQDKNNRTAIWDTKMTHFSLNKRCEDFPPSTIYKDIQENKSISITFWGRKLIIDPPYVGEHSWEETDIHIFRSSKWTPFLKGVDFNTSDEFKLLLSSISDTVTQLREIQRIKGLMNATLFYQAEEYVKNSAYSIYQYLTDTLSSIKAYIGLIIKVSIIFSITCVMYLVVKIFKWVTTKDKTRKVQIEDYFDAPSSMIKHKKRVKGSSNLLYKRTPKEPEI